MSIDMNGHKKPRQYSDQMHCSHCGKQWDVNDPEPPPCKTGTDWVREIKDKLKDHNHE